MAIAPESQSLTAEVETYVRRSLGLFKILLELHLEIAQREAAREQRRLLLGLVAASIGIGLLAMGTGLLQAIAVWWVHRLGLTWFASLASVAVGDTLLGLLALLIAVLTLRGGYMSETRRRVASTTATLLQDQDSH
ncbi:phage holin family protein [Phormidium yuhuli AB48]|uniref:Phage holin family protein n=1 Tax=Phormidium yuhuli AB48 TaxID=2940671 RepID=A0ABY5APF2_9CYAN|nr:phage holin family protein [Phormidium yuhuli]USR90727.1 phage holin family protein [Phormidium yuhuli AB48]